jgi:TPR repeat protein
MRASDLGENGENISGPSAALYWLPYYDLLGRDDSLYRRTVKPLETVETDALFTWCARLVGPDGSRALEWLRRAPLDGGLAAEVVDADGRATANGGDAALSGLIAFTAWYAVNALGVSI